MSDHRPRSSVLHGDVRGDSLLVDVRGDNLLVDEDGRAWAIDLDDAVYGDGRYGYVRAARTVAGDEAARAVFGEGYERVRGPPLDEDGALWDRYVLLSIAKESSDGEWCRRNAPGVDVAGWADGLAEWYRDRFG